MTIPVQQLVDQFAGALRGSGHPATQPWLFRPLVRLLAEGVPVAVDRLAEAAGTSAEQVRQVLAAEPDTEYATRGRVVGLGLTQNPTPHRVEVDGRTLYGWCAMDTLMFPLILQRAVRVVSTCPATGTEVRLRPSPSESKMLNRLPRWCPRSRPPRTAAACALRCATRATSSSPRRPPPTGNAGTPTRWSCRWPMAASSAAAFWQPSSARMPPPTTSTARRA